MLFSFQGYGSPFFFDQDFGLTPIGSTQVEAPEKSERMLRGGTHCARLTWRVHLMRRSAERRARRMFSPLLRTTLRGYLGDKLRRLGRRETLRLSIDLS